MALDPNEGYYCAVKFEASGGTLLSVCAAVIIFPLQLPVRDYAEPHTSMFYDGYA